MFIAARAEWSAKLREERHVFVFARIPQGDLSRQNLGHAAPTELNRASRLVVSINMALLTELDRSASA